MKVFAVICFCVCLLRCADDPRGVQQAVKAQPPVDSTQLYIRQAVVDQMGEPKLADDRGKLIFADSVYHFGRVRRGRTVRYRFRFTNEGKAPLTIQDARSSCGCTVTDFPGQAVEPGGVGSVAVTLNTSNLAGNQDKPVALIIKNQPQPTVVYLRGTILN